MRCFATVAVLLAACLCLNAPFARAEESAGTAELQKAIDRHAKRLTSFARKQMKRDVDLAERALRKVLVLRPQDETAQELLSEIGRSGEITRLFAGESLDAFAFADAPQWKLEGREVRARCKQAAYMMRSIDTFKGNYAVTMEARLIAEHEGSSLFTVGGEANDQDARFELGVLSGNPWLNYRFGRGPDDYTEQWTGVPDDVRPRLDPRAWNTYEVRFLGDRVAAYINGQQVASVERKAATAGGHACVVAQNCDLAIRRIEVRVYR